MYQAEKMQIGTLMELKNQTQTIDRNIRRMKNTKADLETSDNLVGDLQKKFKSLLDYFI